MAKLVGFYIIMLIFVANLDYPGSGQVGQFILWGLSPIVAISAFISRYSTLKKLPLEYYLYASLIIISLPALLIVKDVSGFFRYYRVIFSNSILMITVYLAIRNIKDLKVIWLSFLISCFLVVLVSYFSQDSQSLDEYNRLSGIVGNANGTAIIARIGMMLAILALILRLHGNSFIFRVSLIALFAFFYYVIILTASRANFAIASLMFPFLILGSSRLSNLQKGLLVSVFSVFVVLVFSDLFQEFYVYQRFLDKSGGIRNIQEENRYKYIMLSIKAFLDYPIIGIGLNQFRYLSGGKISHTDLMDIATQTGILGFVAYGGMYYNLYRRLIKNLRRLSRHFAPINRWLLLFFISEFIFGFFGTNWFFQVHMIFFSFLVAMAQLIRKRPKEVYLSLHRR